MVYKADTGPGVPVPGQGDGGHEKALPADVYELIAQLSHDLRTPLGVMLGFTDLVLEGAGGPLTKQQRLLLDHVRGGGRRALAILDNYLKQAEAGRAGK